MSEISLKTAQEIVALRQRLSAIRYTIYLLDHPFQIDVSLEGRAPDDHRFGTLQKCTWREFKVTPDTEVGKIIIAALRRQHEGEEAETIRALRSLGAEVPHG